MKKLTLKEMTESEQRDVKTQLDKARINIGRALTNSEQNKVKDEAIEKGVCHQIVDDIAILL